MNVRLPIVGVMGSGVEPWVERAEPLGRWLAEQDVHLLTGGGGGVMATVTRAFAQVPGRRGVALGILPACDEDGGLPPGYPNAGVEIPIQTHLLRAGELGDDQLSRNHINVLSSTVVVALPGGAGTASEVRLAVRYGRPVIGYLRSRSEIPGLPDEVSVSAELAGVQVFVRTVLRTL
jgi:uncharacterized protein (TIGR00725 family)